MHISKMGLVAVFVVVTGGCSNSSSGAAAPGEAGGAVSGAAGSAGSAGAVGGATGSGGAGAGAHVDATLVDNGDGTLADAANGLMWETVGDSGPWDGFMIRQRCQAALATGGKTGWRTPTADELRTLLVGCPATQASGGCPTPPTGASCNGCGAKDAGSCYMTATGFPHPCAQVWALPEGSHVNFDSGAVMQTNDTGFQAREIHCVRSLP